MGRLIERGGVGGPDGKNLQIFDLHRLASLRVCIVVVLPSGRTLGTTTSLNFLSLFVFYFLLLICFLVIYSLKVFNFHQRSIFTLAF